MWKDLDLCFKWASLVIAPFIVMIIAAAVGDLYVGYKTIDCKIREKRAHASMAEEKVRMIEGVELDKILNTLLEATRIVKGVHG